MPTPRARGPSLASRAILAVALTVGFYLLSVTLIGLLLYFAWYQATQSRRTSVTFVIAAIVGAGAILWSILPRFRNPSPPGPRLTQGAQPRLFQVLRAVARETGQSMPAVVYVDPYVNAGVLQEGGFFGFGGRRVMVLGLPLLAALRVSEFRAVVAHEFGHYAGGETRLGPWIYRTRETIGRTIGILAGVNGYLELPFRWYGTAFLRITTAISRRQELAADRLAAEVAGAPAVAAGLRRTHSIDSSFRTYFKKELIPVLSSGFRPPVGEGFSMFLRSESVSTVVEETERKLARKTRGSSYDTHPPLGERLAALGNPDPEEPGPGNPRAITLLEDVDAVEQSLLLMLFPQMPDDLEPLAWEDAGLRVFVPSWRTYLRKNQSLLGSMTAWDLPAALAPRPVTVRRYLPAKEPGAEESVPEGLVDVAACAVALVLLDRGWNFTCEPGVPICFGKGEVTVRPFDEVQGLRAGLVTPRAWEARVEAMGIAHVPLAEAAGKEPPSSTR